MVFHRIDQAETQSTIQSIDQYYRNPNQHTVSLARNTTPNEPLPTTFRSEYVTSTCNIYIVYFVLHFSLTKCSASIHSVFISYLSSLIFSLLFFVFAFCLCPTLINVLIPPSSPLLQGASPSFPHSFPLPFPSLILYSPPG